MTFFGGGGETSRESRHGAKANGDGRLQSEQGPLTLPGVGMMG